MPDFPGLWYEEERTEVADWLKQQGWHVDAADVHDVMARYQRGKTGGIYDSTQADGRIMHTDCRQSELV